MAFGLKKRSFYWTQELAMVPSTNRHFYRSMNRVLVHPNCHQQIHSQGLDVGKPRPAKGVREA
jgi:hypothetical protein